MNPAQRKIYFRLWTAACDAQGWNPKDDTQRHLITGSCMECIHRDPRDSRAKIRSTSDLTQPEVTALFVLLQHLGAPSDPVLSARWLECQADYRAFNLARNADWFQAIAGYGKKSRIHRDRFGGRTTAEAQGFEAQLVDPPPAADQPYGPLKQRLITMSVRARKKLKEAEREADARAIASHVQPLCTAPAADREDPLQAHAQEALHPSHATDDDANPFW